MRTIKPSRSVAILAALILVTALGQAGSAATRPEHGIRSAGAISCDPDDLPGAAEGPDDDGDECNFTITGHHPLPPVDQDPTGEFAQGSAALAKTCNAFTFFRYQFLGVSAAASMGNLLKAPTGEAWLLHFLGGTGTAIHLDDNSQLAAAVKSSSVFKNYDKVVQAEIKKDLDSGVQNVMLNYKDPSSSIHNTPDFSAAPRRSDPHWAFGGTQGVDVSGSGFPQHGQYVADLTYTIRDIYGFYQNKRVDYGPEMHYLQSICGAPFHKGGAHWFEDSVTVKVKFQQPIG